ncbi:hydrolase [Legionella oakridgensis]|uniref:Acetylornithine deacetylase/succinyl-diaminopimelate desuccinylase-related deacylase n=2 Tax=Legionella oakridgensis TaxID=29423 RepID=W0B9Q5_9GAMM|nr:hydrolase [Legionella oakridgensis]AHE67248.1 acetylornithine deacetylase/succinyl-diaminopimelate desuccinylase-related deacylase [Legionella oakridgensis ATCC 33761 = DSM 21215]ETO93208.1 acetylornithine deacetylase/succinyl-diaminopimelate desuccinylase [Legionella oakridgensis RV-2-2007]KTD37957.1 carboxypeptidase G2 [Legionella oakridgensis]STY20322.1 carboxypeptidase G2 [Legionella longbeachae]
MLNSLPELIHSVRANHSMMIAQLHQFCEINSGTDNLPGLKAMHQALHSVYIPLADEIQSRSMPPVTTINMAGKATMTTSGNILYIRKRPELKRRILLSGHMDTVYGAHHPFQTLTYVNENHLIGPGVADMKGGLVVMLHALSTFEKTPFATKLGWDVIINADEETGSIASSALLDELAPNYQAALVYEPAMTADGMLAKNRKGSGKLTLIATGRAAHAGRAFHEGRNAICYLANAILAVDALNGKKEGVTINIGKIAGGDALNVVPDKAVAKLDIRISQPEDERWVRDQLDQIINQLQQDDYSLTVHGDFGRPVKRVTPATERLFQRIQHIGEELNLTVDWQDSGGCCDGNNLARYGLPVIDTLGVRGGHIHSSNEYILLDSLVERATLNALLLVDLAQGGLEELSGKS